MHDPMYIDVLEGMVGSFGAAVEQNMCIEVKLSSGTGIRTPV